ncbi:MAG: site-specific integrase [Erysipelotrichaceae bacterium]|nr:site-specific integrase [Erysipelotrichaceae bacterium]
MSIEKKIIKTKTGAQKTKYRFRTRYTDHHGNQKNYGSIWYDSARAAKIAEAEFKLHQKEPSLTVTFEEVVEDWIEFTKPNNKPKTTKDKRSTLQQYCSCLMDKPIITITPKRMKDMFRDPLINKGSTSRKNKIYDFTKAVFKHAVIFFGLPSNPMDQVVRFRKTEEERMKEMNVYSYTQFMTLYNCLAEDGYPEQANFMYILYWTGLRERELLSVTFKDFDGRSLRIWRQYTNGQWSTLKTKESKRRISLNKTCLSVIERQMDKYSSMPGFNRDWFIFGGYRPIADRTLQRIHAKTIKRHGLDPIRIHDMRHSHVSMLIDQGVNIYKISKRLGHSSIRMTLDRYGHLLDRDETEILDAIDNIIWNENLKNVP